MSGLRSVGGQQDESGQTQRAKLIDWIVQAETVAQSSYVKGQAINLIHKEVN